MYNVYYVEESGYYNGTYMLSYDDYISYLEYIEG